MTKPKKTLAAAGKRMKSRLGVETVAQVKNVPLSWDELEILREAIDSHIYWQLSDEKYRADGFVDDPGSDDPDLAKEIKEAGALLLKLGGGR